MTRAGHLTAAQPARLLGSATGALPFPRACRDPTLHSVVAVPWAGGHLQPGLAPLWGAGTPAPSSWKPPRAALLSARSVTALSGLATGGRPGPRSGSVGCPPGSPRVMLGARGGSLALPRVWEGWALPVADPAPSRVQLGPVAAIASLGAAALRPPVPVHFPF